MSAWHPSIASAHSRLPRRCSRNGCSASAVATLTYVYADSTAVIGPLAASAEPHSYDLCGTHAHNLTAPRGWALVRAEGECDLPAAVPALPAAAAADDLVAIADAVREARPARLARVESGAASPAERPTRRRRPAAQRGHLRVLPPAPS